MLPHIESSSREKLIKKPQTIVPTSPDLKVTKRRENVTREDQADQQPFRLCRWRVERQRHVVNASLATISAPMPTPLCASPNILEITGQLPCPIEKISNPTFTRCSCFHARGAVLRMRTFRCCTH